MLPENTDNIERFIWSASFEVQTIIKSFQVFGCKAFLGTEDSLRKDRAAPFLIRQVLVIFLST